MNDTAVVPVPGAPAAGEGGAAGGHRRRGRWRRSGRASGSRAGRRRHRWRWVSWSIVAVAVLVVGYAGVTFLQVWSASHRDDRQPSGAIVVLGAAQYNGRPSPVLEARLDHGLQLWRQHLAPYLVVTGGKQPGDRYTEATSGYDYLRQHGVPDDAILKEVQGASTYESLAASARFLKPRGITNVLLVSDSYHNERLLAIAHEVGLKGHVSPAHDHLSTTTELRHLLRETAAVSVGRIISFRRLDHR